MLDVRRREFITLLGGAALAGALPAAAQKRTALIGLLRFRAIERHFRGQPQRGAFGRRPARGSRLCAGPALGRGELRTLSGPRRVGRWGHVGSSYGNAGGPRRVNKLMRAPAPSTLGHLPAWAGITIIVCLVLFLADFWFAIVTGRLIMAGLGVLALVIAGACAMAYWPAEVPERHELVRGMDLRRRPR
jgi:hypothetical protein